MCGRFTLQNPSDILADLFDLDDVPDLKPRYNIAPTQTVVALRAGMADEPRELVYLRWGLIPFFAKDAKMGARMINARSETVHLKPSFRGPFKHRRCLIPTDGFFEWRKVADGKMPFHIGFQDRSAFAMAGLFERWKNPEGEVVESCTILTTEPNPEIAPIHDRMPVILGPDDWDLWLDPGIESRQLLEPLFSPWEGTKLVPVPVSKHVNSPRNDDINCVLPISP